MSDQPERALRIPEWIFAAISYALYALLLESIVEGFVFGSEIRWIALGVVGLYAVASYGLAGSDFAPTDLTLEMLYLVEAKSAALEESSKLNLRLNGARQAAEAEKPLTRSVPISPSVRPPSAKSTR